MFLKFLDLSLASRVFVVGDIHGEFTILDDRLADLKFDYERDRLLSVGDLVDRGPESERAIEYAVQPWFDHVRGNHEELCEGALRGDMWQMHRKNGGMWFDLLSDDDRREHSRILNNAPVAIEALLPSGRRIGVVHADIPTNDWDDMRNLAPEMERSWTRWCMWNRDRLSNPPLDGIRNIDHVYFGHTPKKSVYRVGNTSWIDTGAFATKNLTVLEIK
jgi:serine/threonine protein phosphatase 1